MPRHVMWILITALVLIPLRSHGEWSMRIHKGAAVTDYAVAEIDSISFEPLAEPMTLLGAGAFDMGDGTAYCGVDSRLVLLTRTIYLADAEVTNQRYRDALQWAYDHGHVTATTTTVRDNLDGSTVELVNVGSSSCQISFSGGTFTVDAGKEDHPVVMVTWYGAAAYCDWLSMVVGLPRAYNHSTWSCNGGDPYGAAGYRLPTDAEWEYATQIRGSRIYPWGGGAPACSLANYASCVPGTGVRTTPVGSYPAAPAPLDLHDLAGNVWEWCNDWHTCNLGTGLVTNPTGPPSGSYRVMRGGGWGWADMTLRCSYRLGREPFLALSYVGFRIARSR